MPTLTYDCPRCSTGKTTFDVLGSNFLYTEASNDWVTHFEVPSVCRHCGRISVFEISLTAFDSRNVFSRVEGWKSDHHLNDHFKVNGFISAKHNATVTPPDYIPDDIAAIFREGASCHSLTCYNAAGAMFRLALDMATKGLLPPDGGESGPNRAQRTRLYDRLKWLFDSNSLPRDLRELADCVREDGNDAAHDGTLAKADAEDLLDFSRILLERIYTEPARLQQARERREQRRS